MSEKPDSRKLGGVEIEELPSIYGLSYNLCHEADVISGSRPVLAALYAAAEQFELLKSENDRMGEILQKLGWDPAEGLEDAEERIEALQALARAVDDHLPLSLLGDVELAALEKVRALGALGKETQ